MSCASGKASRQFAKLPKPAAVNQIEGDAVILAPRYGVPMFAGGFLGYLSEAGHTDLRQAVICGSATASFCAKLYISAVETFRGPDHRQIASVMILCVPPPVWPADSTANMPAAKSLYLSGSLHGIRVF